MDYHTNCSGVGNVNYSVNTPSHHYSLGNNDASYSVTLNEPRIFNEERVYQGTGNYALPETKVQTNNVQPSSNQLITQPAKRAEVLMPNESIKNGFVKPIDQLIEEFLPAKHTNSAIDEIQRAIGTVISMDSFEVEEEIIIRRRIKKKSVKINEIGEKRLSLL